MDNLDEYVTDTLIMARNRLAEEGAWIQGCEMKALYTDGAGFQNYYKTDDPSSAEKFCSKGAIFATIKMDLPLDDTTKTRIFSMAHKYLAGAINIKFPDWHKEHCDDINTSPESQVILFNDFYDRTKDQVLEAFDNAIKMSKDRSSE